MPEVSILGPIRTRMLKHDTDVTEMAPMRPAIPGFLLGHGAAGAGLVLMGYLLAYLIRFEALLGQWSTPYVLTVVVSVMVMVLLTVRKEEGMLSFGRAFGLSLLAGFLVRLGYNAFMLLLFHVIRPDLADVYVGLVVQQAEEAMAAFNMIEWPDIAEMVEESTRYSLTLTGQLGDACASLIWLAFVAAIVSLILRRKPRDGGGFRG